MPNRTLTFTIPLKREGCTHVVIHQNRGFLFDNYNDAYAFQEFMRTWLGSSEDATYIIPLTVIDE